MVWFIFLNISTFPSVNITLFMVVFSPEINEWNKSMKRMKGRDREGRGRKEGGIEYERGISAPVSIP